MPEDGRRAADEGTLAVLQAMLTTFTGVLDGMESRLATMEEALHSLHADQAGIKAGLSEVRAALTDHPAATVFDTVARMTRQVDLLVAQPGPGPAMAMVAAGLSERFEKRTQGLVELLQEHAELMHALTEQVQAAMQGLVAAVEGRQAGLDALLDTVRAVGVTIEGLGARIEEARDGVEAVFQAGEDLPAVVESLCGLEETIGEMVEKIEQQSLAGLTGVVRDESELLAQRLAAVAASLDSVGAMVASHVEESAHSLGRKASDAGRRLVADLGLAPRPRERPTRPAPPSSRKRPPPERES